ncbi:unnamed protein product [Candidula unifasciata]|uniref:guanylate cyclase n=1 Tax=Candidula unifasciata TaxID=100452 RepID=A0A8S3ZCB5_9EUPU|nr:unnamed protein product [Candidula unifasciata]
MYGHIHCVVRELVLSKFGQESWDTILKEAGINEREHFMLFYHYSDDVILSLVAAASKCLNLPAETVLEVFGDYFLIHCLRHGYDDMLRTLGSDITSFIQNLDSLHSLLALTYGKIVAPSFRCETNKDSSLTLHYYSARTGLHPLVKGVLKAVAREIFDQEVEIAMISEVTEKLDDEREQNHVTFVVNIVKLGPDGVRVANDKKPKEVSSPVALTKGQFVSIFPYHLIFDEALRLLQFGCSVAKLSPVPLTEGMDMSSSFRILYPRMSFTVANIQQFINAIYVIAVDPHDSRNNSNIFSMKGQMIWLADSKLMIFIGSPRLTSLKEMKRMNVFMADIPLYDVTREMVLLYQQRNAEIDITKKLDETTAELKRTSRELELEKQKTERLLYQMLPEKVANQLKNGQKVEAEKFDRVTILFSDIVTFTNIAAACSPLDVVNMLNDMYHRFDLKTSEHGVYKVETIGDAYMVVCGVPEKTAVHAQPVADFALDMVEQASCVMSPATGKPLQIRVGIHTGPVVAGVVGVKMPRYCLFGDTVNTASRMESHGMPGRIHLSPTTYKALSGQGYLCKCRGVTNIKGKGNMKTYFLIGNRHHVISEPDDEYIDLEVFFEQGNNFVKLW